MLTHSPNNNTSNWSSVPPCYDSRWSQLSPGIEMSDCLNVFHYTILNNAPPTCIAIFMTKRHQYVIWLNYSQHFASHVIMSSVRCDMSDRVCVQQHAHTADTSVCVCVCWSKLWLYGPEINISGQINGPLTWGTCGTITHQLTVPAEEVVKETERFRQKKWIRCSENWCFWAHLNLFQQ